MEKYLVSLNSDGGAPDNPKNPSCRRRWKRSEIELCGRLDPRYQHDLLGLLMQSYHEIGVFRHLYHVGGVPCSTHKSQLGTGVFGNGMETIRKRGVSDLEFDPKGIYLVSVTRAGCLTVHDFETLYCQSRDTLSDLKEDESKQVLHISLHQQLDSVRWNPANLDEVACTSTKGNDIKVFDIGYVSSEPVEVLQTRRAVNIIGSHVNKGLCDIAFTSTDESRLIASDTHGMLNVWDRRMSVFPCLELATASRASLNSIQIHVENQIIFVSDKQGNINAWDLRGGKSSAAFQSHKEVNHPPLASLKLATMLEKIDSLKAQSNIVPQEIHSIDLNPFSPYQLAFHLDDGWSGVLDINSFQVTHVHCPPPAWLDGPNNSADQSYLRKPSWLPTHSIYAVGSSSDHGIHLLDFYPDSSSPSHVDYNEELSNRHYRAKQNRFVPLSEGVTACAAHPLNGTIVAGTKDSSLLVVSQKNHSVSEEGH